MSEQETLDQQQESIGGPMPPGLSVFRPQERLIYKYFDGQKDRLADPIVLYRRVMNKAPEIDADMKAANHPGFGKADEAYESLIKKLQYVFSVKPLEEGGLAPTELEDLLDHFLIYADWVKKNSSRMQTFVTGTSEATEPSSVESQPTPSTSVSGSTDKESSTEKLMPAPSVTPSPQAESAQTWRIGVT